MSKFTFGCMKNKKKENLIAAEARKRNYEYIYIYIANINNTFLLTAYFFANNLRAIFVSNRSSSSSCFLLNFILCIHILYARNTHIIFNTHDLATKNSMIALYVIL